MPRVVRNRRTTPSCIAILGVAEGVPDRVLHVGECLVYGATERSVIASVTFSDEPVLALEAVLQADEGAVRVFGLDAAHGRGDGLLLDFLYPRVALVDGVGAVDGLHGGPVLKCPLHPDSAAGFPMAGVLARRSRFWSASRPASALCTRGTSAASWRSSPSSDRSIRTRHHPMPAPNVGPSTPANGSRPLPVHCPGVPPRSDGHGPEHVRRSSTLIRTPTCAQWQHRSSQKLAFRSRHGHGSEGRSCRLSAGAGRVAGMVTERAAQRPPAASISAIRLARANLEISATRGDETQGEEWRVRADAGDDEDQVDKHGHQLLGVPRTCHMRRKPAVNPRALK